MIDCRISECARGDERPIVEQPKLIVIHHCSLSRGGSDNPNPIPDGDLTAYQLASRFKLQRLDPPLGLGTRGRVPYHFLVRVSGLGEQLLPLDVQGAHAMRWYNQRTLAVATVGERGVNPAQHTTLIEIIALLLIASHGGRLAGHSSLRGASRPGHPICPHPTLSVAGLEAECRARLPEGFEGWDQHAINTQLIAGGIGPPRADDGTT